MFGSSNNSPFGGGGGGGGGFGSSGAGFNSQPAFGGSNTFGGGGGGAFGTPAPAPSFGGGFGGGASTPFGSPSPAPAFGGGSTFGGNSTFGQSNNAGSAFGQNNNNSFGGGFGGNTNTGGFGASSGFGASNTGGFGGSSAPFGSPAPAPSGIFGSSPAPAQPFGAPAPAGGGLFGSAPAPSTGLFGSSGPAPAPFGGTSSTFGGFGGSTPAPAPFGAPAAPFGGSPAPAPFGSFGAPAPAAGGGMFGAAPAGNAQGGTKQIPYQVTNRQDGTSSIAMQTITAMQPYETKSLEELRYEDYMMGNKGSGNAPGGTGGGFGSSFGAGAPSSFGGSNTFGKPATGSLFGGNPAPAPTPGFGFGAPAPSPGMFGSSTPAPAPGFGGGFGAPAPAPSAFGGTPAPSPGLFGSAPAPAFGGTPAPSTGFGGFGSNPAPAPAFGATPSPGLFGSSPAPAFGGAPASTFSFGGGSTPAPATGGFGSAPAPGTGIFGSSTSAFGSNPAPAPFGGFGGFGGSNSTFGAAAPSPGIFGGGPAPSPGYGFGQSPQAPAQYGQPLAAAATTPALPPAGAIIPQATSEVLNHQIQALENKRKEMEKLDVWRGKSAEESSVTPVSQPQFESTGISSTSQFSSYRPSPRSTAKIRPRGFGPAVSPNAATSTTSPSLNSISKSGGAMMSPDAYAASSVKRLVIKPGAVTPKPKMRLRLSNGLPTTETKATQPAATEAAQSPLQASTGTGGERVSSPSPMKSPVATGTPHGGIPIFGGSTPTSEPATPASVRVNTNVGSGGKTVASLEKIAPPPDPAYEYYQKVVGSPDGVSPDTSMPQSTPQSRKKRPSYLPKLTKPDYVVTPTLAELASMSEVELATVTGFSVRRDPYGMVEWEGAIDVRNADLDAAIVIQQNDVSVYTKEEEEGRKPPVGSKLNRPAIITYYNVFPKNGGANADEESKLKLANRIAKATKKMEAELISYDKDSGVWKIRVGHF